MPKVAALSSSRANPSPTSWRCLSCLRSVFSKISVWSQSRITIGSVSLWCTWDRTGTQSSLERTEGELTDNEVSIFEKKESYVRRAECKGNDDYPTLDKKVDSMFHLRTKQNRLNKYIHLIDVELTPPPQPHTHSTMLMWIGRSDDQTAGFSSAVCCEPWEKHWIALIMCTGVFYLTFRKSVGVTYLLTTG